MIVNVYLGTLLNKMFSLIHFRRTNGQLKFPQT
jgi:hypothetical protein